MKALIRLQTAWSGRLICVLAVHIWPKTHFCLLWPIYPRICGWRGTALNRGCGYTMPDLSSLSQFPWGQVRNFNKLVLGKTYIHLAKKSIHIMKYIYCSYFLKKTGCGYSLEVPLQVIRKMSILRQAHFGWSSTFWPFTCLWTSTKIY